MKLNSGAEYFINEAEVFYKRGRVVDAIDSARLALSFLPGNIAINLFIAKCYARLGFSNKSNELYRSLINDKNFIPPMLVGLLHNNLIISDAEKLSRNIELIKLYV